MNVAIVLLNFSFKEVDGIGNYTYRTIMNLAAVENVKKLTVFVELENIKYIENLEWFNFDNIEVKTFALPKSKLFRAITKFFLPPKGLFKDKFEKIIYVAPPVNMFALFFLNVTTVLHDITPLIVERKQSLIFKIYFFLIIWITLKFSKKIACVSESTKKDIKKYFNLSKENIIVSYNTIPNAKLTKSDNIKKYFLVVSTIQPGKNIENIINAFSIFTKKYNLNFELIIVGKYGWGPKNIYDLPKELEIEKYVKFMGYVNEVDLQKLYSEAWALINLSIYEGFGLPVLEAMYYNCPSIVSNVSALPEVCGKTGIKVDPFDIIEISESFLRISDELNRLKLCSFIMEQLVKFDSKSNTEKLLD